MIIPSEKLDEIRTSNDIVDLIGSYLKLVRRGRNYLGLCPFHQEKTPSFTVSPDKQIYHCFSCHVGGNVFTFLQQYEKLSFVDSVKKLAERAGISLVFQETNFEQEKESLYSLNEIATDYFSKNLQKDAGKVSKDYFLNRDITEQTISKFKLGFSINSWEHFLNYATSKGLDIELLYKLGLLGKNQKGGYFDNFRGRIMFPIFSIMGKVAGFGARQLVESNDSGKYINSKESEVYNKSKILYGLNFSKDEIRKNDRAILVEGYMDYLTLYQNGIKNIVASSGTALTADQIKILSRYTKKLLFLYDADSAGIKATIRSLDVVFENDFDVKIVSLGNNEDPDSFVRKYGISKFQESLDKATSFINFMSDFYRKTGKLESVSERTDSVREILSLLMKIKDNLRLEFYLKELAESFNINESLVRKEFDTLNKNSLTKNNFSQTVKKENRPPEVKEAPEKIVVDKAIIYPNKEEEDLIALIIMNGKRTIDFINENLSDNEIKSDITKKTIKYLSTLFDNYDELIEDIILAETDDKDILGIITKLYLQKKILPVEEATGKYEDFEASKWKWGKDIIKAIKINSIDAEIQQIQKMIKNAESEKLDCTDLIDQYNKLNEKRRNWHQV
jgi:DNA primase